MNIFICEAWQPFPYSEYGGVTLVIAEDIEQCAEIILHRANEFEQDAFGSSLAEMVNGTVKNAKMYPLTGTHAPGVVYEFIT